MAANAELGADRREAEKRVSSYLAPRKLSGAQPAYKAALIVDGREIAESTVRETSKTALAGC